MQFGKWIISSLDFSYIVDQKGDIMFYSCQYGHWQTFEKIQSSDLDNALADIRRHNVCSGRTNLLHAALQTYSDRRWSSN